MLDVDIAHLISFNEELAHRLSNEPTEILPIVCFGRRCAALLCLPIFSSSLQYETVEGACS
jgi:DNA replication licensing factor MCM5